MTMTITEEIRNIIDDHVQVGISSETSVGGLQVFQLNARNFWNLVIKNSAGAVISQTGMTLYPQSGQVKGTIAAGTITFEYDHSGFSDDEIAEYYAKNGNSVNKTALNLVEILLASAAKRFDYKAGIKDIKASQVFDHLKDLRAQLQEAVEAEDGGANYSGGLFVDRLHPAYTPATDPNANWSGDTSRSES